MEIVYRQAMTEVLEVLERTSRSIVEKIPEEFIMFLKENKEDEYIVNIDFSKEDWEDDIKQETQAILALIYRDDIVYQEKRSKLIIEEQINEIREQYNPDNIFQNKKEEKIKENKRLPVEIKKETFFKKLVSFIKGLFNKAN